MTNGAMIALFARRGLRKSARIENENLFYRTSFDLMPR